MHDTSARLGEWSYGTATSATDDYVTLKVRSTR